MPAAIAAARDPHALRRAVLISGAAVFATLFLVYLALSRFGSNQRESTLRD